MLSCYFYYFPPQTITLKQLRASYETLMEGNRRLLETKDALLRVQPSVMQSPRIEKAAPPVRKEAVLSVVEPRPPSTSKPSSSGVQRASTSKAAVLSGDDQSLGGNLTFITSEMIE
jgi:hypothetical protein